MAAMICATFAWGVWWSAALLYKLDLGWHLSARSTSYIAGAFAAVGILFGFVSIRARRGWADVGALAIFANVSVLGVPWIVDEVELKRTRDAAPASDPG